MAHVNPYLHFAGNCREAMTFYKECLGGELKLMTVGESPMAAQMPPEAHKNILHSTLTGGGLELMASDSFGREGVRHGNNVSLSLVCGSKAEIETLFFKLSAGGRVSHALEEAFFGTHGNLVDKFGLTWMLTYEAPRK